ncbi:MAG: hypothetical protein PHU75_11775 [Candidatus Nanopelagicales bacterium]|nr:hypothetical protein [Candidatus Nanopelagicales bacterium]
MRRSATLAASAVGALIVLGGPATAFAASTPAPGSSAAASARPGGKGTVHEVVRPHLSAADTAKAARTRINVDFKAAVDKAQADYRTAMSAATNASMKAAAVMNRRVAITQAIATRQAAIQALGDARPRP